MDLLHAADDPAEAARVGAKGAGLLEARAAGLPVPAFAILTTDLFRAFRDGGGVLPDALEPALERALAEIEQATGRSFTDPDTPLLVSVRSSPVVSMPGMLETVLDVGARPAALDGLARQLGERAAALDVRRRFLESWGTAVLRVPRARLDAHGDVRLAARGPADRTRDPESLLATVRRHESMLGAGVPDDPRAQLRGAIEAVLRSWDLPRARDARRASGIDEGSGLAVVIQAMVFGNAAPPSGAGVAFTRNPVTGEDRIFGEYLPGGQGDEVVAGRASAAGLAAAASGRRADESLERQCPPAFAQLQRIARDLEVRHRDVQEIELTVERGTLWILQVRTARCAPKAAVRIAVDRVREGTIDRAQALARIEPAMLHALLVRAVPATLAASPLTCGVPASPGATSGRVVFDSDAAVEAAARGERAILVRPECSPEDAPGIRAAAGVLTASGGLTSHAAVIARALGKPCIVAASELRIDLEGRRALVRGAAGQERPLPGMLTLDGGSGRVFEGDLPLEVSFATPEARTIVEWARELGAPGAWADLSGLLPA